MKQLITIIATASFIRNLWWGIEKTLETFRKTQDNRSFLNKTEE